jgi:hypothetical protein
LDIDIKKTMAAEAVEHVIEERHAGFDGGLSPAVEIEFDNDVGLFGFSRYFCRPSHGFSFTFNLPAHSAAPELLDKVIRRF